jgi:hypothetical protein
MIGHQPAERKRVVRASSARRARTVQLDLFNATPRTAARPFDQKRLAQIASYIWQASVSVRGTIAEHCFTARCLALPDPAVAKFHPSLKFNDARAPAILWLLRDTKTGEPTGVLRVYLTADGSTVISRRVLGRAIGATISTATTLAERRTRVTGCGAIGFRPGSKPAYGQTE